MSTGKNRSNNRPFNILFTCVGRRVALVRAFRQALEELKLSGTLIGTDVTVAAPGVHAVDKGEIVPPVRSLHYIPALQELIEREKISLIIPLTDLDLRTLSRHAEEFRAKGCQVMIASPEAVATCRNKLQFNELLHKVGLQGIRSLSLKTFEAQPFYPCFVKPIYGSSAVGAGRIRNDRELKAHVATFGQELLVQEYVPGQEYTIDVFRRRDGVVCAAVPRQRLSIRGGEVEKGITINDPLLIECACKLASHLDGLWGVMNAQCRRAVGGEPRFFEVNPRFGGGAPLSIAAGVNLPKMVIMEALGLPVEPAVGQFTDKLLMLRYEDAYFVPVDDPATLPGFSEPANK